MQAKSSQAAGRHRVRAPRRPCRPPQLSLSNTWSRVAAQLQLTAASERMSEAARDGTLTAESESAGHRGTARPLGRPAHEPSPR